MDTSVSRPMFFGAVHELDAGKRITKKQKRTDSAQERERERERERESNESVLALFFNDDDVTNTFG